MLIRIGAEKNGIHVRVCMRVHDVALVGTAIFVTSWLKYMYESHVCECVHACPSDETVVRAYDE